MRKLASIQAIAEVAPIPEADAIESVRINGWWVVFKSIGRSFSFKAISNAYLLAQG